MIKASDNRAKVPGAHEEGQADGGIPAHDQALQVPQVHVGAVRSQGHTLVAVGAAARPDEVIEDPVVTVLLQPERRLLKVLRLMEPASESGGFSQAV